MADKRLLVVLDFDGVLLNSYALIRETMESFGLDVGDEERFRNRRKFLKYLGGGKELLNNLIGMSLPKTRKLRARLTECYFASGFVYPEFIDVLNNMIANPLIHCGIISRNFTLRPGPTIRAVLRRSGVNEDGLDFVVPVPIGAGKVDVLDGMLSARYGESLLCADEIGDYHAARDTGYESLIGSYGFDTGARLVKRGEVPASCIYDTPDALARELRRRIACYDARSANYLVPEPVMAARPSPMALSGAR